MPKSKSESIAPRAGRTIGDVAAEMAKARQTKKGKPAKASTSGHFDVAQIEIPVVYGVRNSGPRHVDIHLSSKYAKTFADLGQGLVSAGAVIVNDGFPREIGYGRTFTGDVVRWLLEQLAFAETLPKS